jgi:hypothetical protein
MRSTFRDGCAISWGEASADALADAKLELQAELARDYVTLRGFEDQAKLLSDTIAIYRSALKLIQDQLAAKIASPVDVDRAQTQLKLGGSTIVRSHPQSRDPRKFHCGAGREGRSLIFGFAIFEAAPLAETAWDGARRRAAPSPRCRASGTADRRGERSGRRFARQGPYSRRRCA